MELKNKLIDAGLVKIGDFTLKSGAKSSTYFDLRELVSHPELLSQLAEVISKKIAVIKPDLLVGLAYGSIPLTVAVSLKSGIPMVFNRKEVKDYGTKKQLEGKFKKGQRCIILDDVISSGKSKVEAVELIESAGLVVEKILVIIDREEPLDPKFKALNIPVEYLWRKSDFDKKTVV